MPSLNQHWLARLGVSPVIPSKEVVVSDAVDENGFSLGSVSTVSSLCPRRHVCVGHRNNLWFLFLHAIHSDFIAAASCPRRRLLIESSVIKLWHDFGGTFIRICGPHFVVCDKSDSHYLVRSYLVGGQPRPGISEISVPIDEPCDEPCECDEPCCNPAPARSSVRTACRSPGPVRRSPRSLSSMPQSNPRRSSRLPAITPAVVVTPSPSRRRRRMQKHKPDQKTNARKAGSHVIRYRCGTVVWRLFDDGWFKGKVERRPTSEHPFYLISYSDGDMEEMVESQIDALIQKREKHEQQAKDERKRKRKEKEAVSAPLSKKKKAGKVSSGLYFRGMYLEMPSELTPDAVNLDDEMVARLGELGCHSKDWLKLATRVYNDFLRGVERHSKYKPQAFEPLGWLAKGRRSRIRKSAVVFHCEVVAPLRRKGSRAKHGMPRSPRDGWADSSWFFFPFPAKSRTPV